MDSTETRTLEELREHYEIEKALAERLRSAPREARRTLYAAIYDELFQRVPNHPQLTRAVTARDVKARVSSQLRLLEPFLRSDVTFLEIGPGDCAISFEVARRVRRVYGLDVTSEVPRGQAVPANFQLILGDGCSIPLADGMVDVAYSNQLMEHLHPEDAVEQLRGIHRALAPGGVYICITPNRLNGPHDISAYFDRQASGLHLKEYTNEELACLFREAGFSHIRAYVGVRGQYLSLPVGLSCRMERALAAVPFGPRRRLASALPLRKVLGIRLIARKGTASRHDWPAPGNPVR